MKNLLHLGNDLSRFSVHLANVSIRTIIALCNGLETSEPLIPTCLVPWDMP